MEVVNGAMVGILRAVPPGLLWRFARRYVAGATLDEAVTAVRDLNGRGFLATLDILGEHVSTEAEARAALAEIGDWVKTAGLTLHPVKTRIVNAADKGGFDFLGYHFEQYREGGGK